MIEALEETYPVSDLCAALYVSRAGFYTWRQRDPSERDQTDAALSEEISAVFNRSRRPTAARVYTVPCVGRAMPVDAPRGATDARMRPGRPGAGKPWSWHN